MIAAPQAKSRKQSLGYFPFMQLPLELRQRVYDFHLSNYNKNFGTPGTAHATIFGGLSGVYYLPISKRDAVDPLWQGDSEEPPVSLLPPPSLMRTELRDEVAAYFLRSKLTIELEAIRDFILQKRRFKAAEMDQILRLNIITDLQVQLSARKDINRYGGATRKVFGKTPTVSIVLKDEGKAIEVQSAWRLEGSSQMLWQRAMEVVIKTQRKAGRTTLDGKDVLEVAYLTWCWSSIMEVCPLEEQNVGIEEWKKKASNEEIWKMVAEREAPFEHVICASRMAE